MRNLVTHLKAMRDGAGPDVDILLDLNLNGKTEGFLKILRAITHLNIFWVEIDSFSPEALGYIGRQSPHPISSCETLLGLHEFLPYFREQAMDNEDAIRAHPPKAQQAGLLNLGRES